MLTSSHCAIGIVAMAALRQKQAFEGELNRIAGTRLTLEAQVCPAGLDHYTILGIVDRHRALLLHYLVSLI
jgi:hypothetical protein